MSDVVRIPANVTIEVIDAETGEVLECQQVHNLVTLAGRNLIRNALQGVSISGISHFAIGTGTTAPAAGDTTLETEIYRDSVTKLAIADGTLTASYYLSSAAQNGNTLTEAGLLNAASGGTLVARATHNAIVKTSSVAVSYSWELAFNAA